MVRLCDFVHKDSVNAVGNQFLNNKITLESKSAKNGGLGGKVQINQDCKWSKEGRKGKRERAQRGGGGGGRGGLRGGRRRRELTAMRKCINRSVPSTVMPCAREQRAERSRWRARCSCSLSTSENSGVLGLREALTTRRSRDDRQPSAAACVGLGGGPPNPNKPDPAAVRTRQVRRRRFAGKTGIPEQKGTRMPSDQRPTAHTRPKSDYGPFAASVCHAPPAPTRPVCHGPGHRRAGRIVQL